MKKWHCVTFSVDDKGRMMDGHAWQGWRDTPKGGKQ